MELDGFYTARITGTSGQGLAIFVFQSGILVGCDPLGVQFDGHYEADEVGSTLRGSVTVKAPPGGMTVQGVNTGPNGITYTLPFELPTDFGLLNFIRLETPLGPVNMTLKKMRGLKGQPQC